MKKVFTFEDVRKIALALPGVEESSSYGAPSLKFKGKLLMCPAINKSAEPGSMVARVSFDQRQDLMAEAPEIYYVTDHYVNYPCVLIRLSRIDGHALRGLVRMSWQFVNQELSSSNRKPRKRTAPRSMRKSR